MVLKLKCFLGLLLFLISCQPEYPVASNAMIVGEGIDCGWLVKFNEIPADLPSSSERTYIAVNLSKTYQMGGTEVFLEAREATATELLTCTAMGPAYSQIFIVSIK